MSKNRKSNELPSLQNLEAEIVRKKTHQSRIDLVKTILLIALIVCALAAGLYALGAYVSPWAAVPVGIVIVLAALLLIVKKHTDAN